MEIFFYIIIFMIGIAFGSFYTLAVYRIPLGLDITHEHSFCPNCKHKLGFLDLFPVFSYIFLRGKCRYCGMKIKPRYCILEVLSGLTFVAFTYSLNINLYNLEKEKLILLAFSALYFAGIFIIAGIDKEKIFTCDKEEDIVDLVTTDSIDKIFILFDVNFVSKGAKINERVVEKIKKENL